MNKEQIQSLLKEQLALKTISAQDVIDIAEQSKIGTPEEKKSLRATHVFYAIGGLIICIGAIIFITNHWNDIGFIGRIAVTLGIAVVSYSIGLLLKDPVQHALSETLLTVSGVLMPIGMYVLFTEMHVVFTNVLYINFFAVLLGMYIIASFVSKKTMPVFMSVVFGTCLYYAIISNMLNMSLYGTDDILQYATLFLGFSYVAIGNFLSKHMLQNLMYQVGILLICITSMVIGGLFDILLVGFIFIAFYGSFYLKNSSMLLLSSGFLVAHTINLTGEYFIDSLGWPMSLISIGILIMGIGYSTYQVNKKYIKQ